MPPGNRPPRHEDEAYNTGHYVEGARKKKNPMKGKFVGVKGGRQQKPTEGAIRRRLEAETSRKQPKNTGATASSRKVERRVQEDDPRWDWETMGNKMGRQFDPKKRQNEVISANASRRKYR